MALASVRSQPDQQRFLQALIALDISAERANELFLSYLRTRRDTGCSGANGAYARNDREQGRAFQGDVSITIEALDRAGEDRSRQQMEVDALRLMGQGLNLTQRDDMMRGAMQAGFSAPALFAYQAMMNEQERQRRAPTDVSDELQLATDNLRQMVTLEATQRMQQLRSAQAAYDEQMRLNGEASPQVRQRRDEEAARLARLFGSNAGAVIKEAQGGDTDRTIATGWTNGLMNLHMHNLAGSVPVKLT